jgi:uncharacterized protein YidB (DUF937 family)
LAGEGPLVQSSRADEIDQRAGDTNARGDRQSFGGIASIHKNKEKAGHGRERRKWVERDAEGPWEFWALHAQ